MPRGYRPRELEPRDGSGPTTRDEAAPPCPFLDRFPIVSGAGPPLLLPLGLTSTGPLPSLSFGLPLVRSPNLSLEGLKSRPLLLGRASSSTPAPPPLPAADPFPGGDASTVPLTAPASPAGSDAASLAGAAPEGSAPGAWPVQALASALSLVGPRGPLLRLLLLPALLPNAGAAPAAPPAGAVGLPLGLPPWKERSRSFSLAVCVRLRGTLDETECSPSAWAHHSTQSTEMRAKGGGSGVSQLPWCPLPLTPSTRVNQRCQQPGPQMPPAWSRLWSSLQDARGPA